MTVEIRLNSQVIAGGLPEESGVYKTPLGNVGVELRVGQERDVQEVLLDCTNCESLQGKKGLTQRVINLSAKGIGSQQISPTERVVVDLGRRISPEAHYMPVEYHSYSLGDGNRVKRAWVPVP